MGDFNSRPVFSSDDGSLCKKCGEVPDDCRCVLSGKSIPSGDSVRIHFDSKGRRGKAVSVITGLPLAPNELKGLAKELKKRCGSGGAVKDSAIEIQGDHRDTLMLELSKRGFNAKKAGGPA